MSEHEELVAELAAASKMSTGERLKHARKKRAQQLKKYAQYEKDLMKKSAKRLSSAPTSGTSGGGRPRNGVRFVSNVILLEAAMRNDIDEVRHLLENGTSPDSCNDDGLTALHQCCIDNSEEMVKLLVEHGANVDARDSELWTPLHAAATCGHVHLCRYLIEHNADLLAVNADCNMPYDICEDEVTLDYIESEMAKRGITQALIDDLRLSREKTMLEDLKKLALSSADLECRGRQGETPLHIAAANGYLDVTEFLLGHDVTVDCIDSDTWQPIHCAACWGQLQVLEMLLEHGATLDAKTKNGETPIDICEDLDLKQRIEEIRVAIESSKIVKAREIPHRRSINVRSASVRRTSMREKKAISWKEAREEAQKLRESATASNSNDDDDEEKTIGAANGIAAPTVKVDYLNANHTQSAPEIAITLTTESAKYERSPRPDLGAKVETVPKGILSTSKRNGHTSSAKPEDAKATTQARRPTGYSPSGAEEVSSTGAVTEAGTTLADLKRQRAQSRTNSTPTSPGSSSVSNGITTASPKAQQSAPIQVIESDEKRCCVIL